jgi:hypothetical protein
MDEKHDKLKAFKSKLIQIFVHIYLCQKKTVQKNEKIVIKTY